MLVLKMEVQMEILLFVFFTVGFALGYKLNQQDGNTFFVKIKNYFDLNKPLK